MADEVFTTGNPNVQAFAAATQHARSRGDAAEAERAATEAARLALPGQLTALTAPGIQAATQAADAARAAAVTLPKFRSTSTSNPAAPTQAELDANPDGIGGLKLTATGGTQQLKWTPHTTAGAWVNVGQPSATAAEVAAAQGTADTARTDLQAARIALRTLGLSIMDRGAKADGVTDDSAAVAQALTDLAAGGGGTLYLPAGDTLANITLLPYVTVQGQGIGSSRLLGRPGVIAPVVQGKDFATLTNKVAAANDHTLGCHHYGLRDLTIDGNGSAEYALRNWGCAPYWSNVVFQRATVDGVWHEWTEYTGVDENGQLAAYAARRLMEGKMRDVWTVGNGRHGMTWRGPHDSNLDNFESLRNGQWGLRIEGRETAGIRSNGGLSGRSWNFYQNGTGSAYFGGTGGQVYNIIPSGGRVGVGIEMGRGGRYQLYGIQTGGHEIGVILRGTGHTLQGDISNCWKNALEEGFILSTSTGAAIVLDGAIGCRVDLTGGDNAAFLVLAQGGELGPNSFTGVVSRPVFQDTGDKAPLFAGAIPPQSSASYFNIVDVGDPAESYVGLPSRTLHAAGWSPTLPQANGIAPARRSTDVGDWAAVQALAAPQALPAGAALADVVAMVNAMREALINSGPLK